MNFDDSDMKIVGEKPDPSEVIKHETREMAKLLEEQKANGNIDKAHQFGKLLAKEVEDVNDLHSDKECADHKQILIAFAGGVSFEGILPNSLLAQTAQSSFNETLRLKSAKFYEELQDSGAFSFYYLCLRDSLARKSDIKWDDSMTAARVGETFAILCGKPEDEKASLQGQQLYSDFVKKVKKIYTEMKFV